MSEWMPIESAPRDGSDLLLWDGAEMLVGCYSEGFTWGWEDGRGHHVHPTHWMPLPAPPALTPDDGEVG